MPNQVERRNVTQEFRLTEDEAPKITGYACVFDQPYDAGWWTEQVDKNAFDSVLAGTPDVRALYNHDANLVLGRTTSGTLTIGVDARGLAYSIDPPDTTYARDLTVSIRRKDVTQSSFGFICKRDRWEDQPDGTILRTIVEFEELLDVSPVTYPASLTTSVTARSLPESMPREIRSRLEKRDEDACLCGCAQCLAGACGLCSADPQCIGAVRSDDSTMRQRMEMQLALASIEP